MKRKRKRSIWSILCMTGLPWIPLFIIGGTLFDRWYVSNKSRGRPPEIQCLLDIDSRIVWISCFLWFIVLARNFLFLMSTNKKIDLLTWLDKWKYEPPSPDDSVRLREAQYPKASEEYLYDEPSQLPLAVQDGKYIQFDLRSNLAVLIFGAPNCGKSTLLRTMLLYHFHIKEYEDEPMPSFFVFDYKNRELYLNSVMPDDDRARCVSLEGRNDWGWDLYYRLTPDSSDDDVIRELTLIANILIDGSNERNSFFTDSAKIILIFVGFFDVRRNKSFLQTIDHICEGDTKTMLKEVFDMCDSRPDMKKVRDAIAEYVVTDDNNEALQNIRMTLKQKLSVFKVEDVRWALEHNPRKASPKDLEDGISIFFYPGDTAVTDIVLKIIAKQLEYHCRHRDFLDMEGKGELRRIITVADECYSIGSVVDFAAWASVARAYKNSLIMVWQSYSQIRKSFDPDVAESLIDSVAGIVVLGVNSSKNAKDEFVDFTGDFLENSRSYNNGGHNDGSFSESYTYRPILSAKDFLQLRKRKEAIILMDGEYVRAQTEPARYYKIPKLKRISEECLEAHKQNFQGGNKIWQSQS